VWQNATFESRITIFFAEADHLKKTRHGNFPWRAWIDLTKSEFKVQIRLEYLILIMWIDGNVGILSPGAVGAVDTPGI
jgi:hypothetical protein